MTKVISYANVQIKYNADTTSLKAHRTDLAAMTRLIRSGETEGEKFVRRIEMISRMSASNKKTQEEVAAATKIAADQLLAAAKSSGRYLEALHLIETVAPNAAVNTRELANAFKAEQQAANDAEAALAAKRRLQADYAMDTVAAKREVKARQDAERAAAQQRLDDIRRNQEMEAAIAKEHVKNVIAEQDKLAREAKEAADARIAAEKALNEALLKEEMQRRQAARRHSQELDRIHQADVERENKRLRRIQRRDAAAFSPIETATRMTMPQQVADFSAKLEKLISDTEKRELAERTRAQQQFHAQRMARSKEFEAEVIRAANSQAKKYAAAQKEVNAIIQQGMTIEERRIQTLRRLDAMVQRRIITEKQHKQAIDAVNRSAARDSTGRDLGMGALAGLTPMGGFTAGAVGAFAAQQTLQFAKDSVNAYAEMRGELVKLEVMLGSVEQAERSYAEFRGIAVKASLESRAVTAAALTLAQFGVATNKLTPIMQRLSMMAAGNSERLQSLALALGQVNAAGRLTGQEALQFVNAGFSPLAEIARVTGVEMSVLRKRMEEGKVSFDDITNSLITATEAGGRFYGMGDKLSKDLPGQIARLKDEFLRLQQAVGEFLATFKEISYLIEQNLRSTRDTVLFIIALRKDANKIISGDLLGQDGLEILSMRETIKFLEERNKQLAEDANREANDAAASAEKARKATDALKRSQGGGFSPTGNFWEDAISQATSFGEQIWEGLNKTREQMQKDVQTVRDAVKPQQMTAEMMSGIADRLAFLVQNFGLAQEDAIKYLAGLQEESKKTNTELPQRIAYGTKQAYEMSVKAQNDIQTKQLHKQEEQLREQKATNEILRRLNMPQMGIVT